MSICRIVHNKENPYVQINKKALWDESLSLEAIGLWARLLSKPDDWEISVAHLCKSCNIGKDKVYRILDNLIEAGYAYRYQERSTGSRKNQFGKFHYIIFEFKASPQEIKKMFTQPGFPLPENTDSGKTDTTNNVITKTEKNKNTTTLPPPKKSDPVPKNSNGGGEFSEEELLKRYETKYHKSVLLKAIEEMKQNKSKKSNPFKYFEAICTRISMEKFSSLKSHPKEIRAANKRLSQEMESLYNKKPRHPSFGIVATENFLEVIRPNNSTLIPYDMDKTKFYDEAIAIAHEFKL